MHILVAGWWLQILVVLAVLAPPLATGLTTWWALVLPSCILWLSDFWADQPDIVKTARINLKEHKTAPTWRRSCHAWFRLPHVRRLWVCLLIISLLLLVAATVLPRMTSIAGNPWNIVWPWVACCAVLTGLTWRWPRHEWSALALPTGICLVALLSSALALTALAGYVLVPFARPIPAERYLARYGPLVIGTGMLVLLPALPIQASAHQRLPRFGCSSFGVANSIGVCSALDDGE